MINKFENLKEIPMGIPEKAETIIVEGRQPKHSGVDMRVKVMDHHFRSALLGRVIFQDNKGRMYRDVDIKGIGPIHMTWLNVRKLEPQSARHLKRGQTPYGFTDWKFAETDREMSEFFLEKGLRTSRVLAVVRLNEIIDEDGDKISINKAKERGYIKTTTEPVLEVRAFGTKARITDANETALTDAKKMIAQEFGRPELEKDNSEYLNWFSETLAKQLAIIHNNGYWHGYLTEHNITLDCRIVDFDSVEKLPPDKSKLQKNIVTDLYDAANSFISLISNLEYVDEDVKGALFSSFIRNYFENCDEKIGNNKIELIELFYKYIEEMEQKYDH
ncbi:MAG: hypothetical protein UV48_C0031G0005 [Candidatus Azambacteria bacterium GW2011_GWA2_42_9]|uniref:Protein kinase domain-containing protein n=1 Tax=Candidatus Azambacteria bacterium GW2011_GWA2_42_9 TaxID=1618613 RepID=A0A0G1DV76_9BACT|nr:MAG: hypothetical protein UV48_C0031G0005 [Candidatus Azambacteria bacterium GW2011_GWA2_42_9]